MVVLILCLFRISNLSQGSLLVPSQVPQGMEEEGVPQSSAALLACV